MRHIIFACASARTRHRFLPNRAVLLPEAFLGNTRAPVPPPIGETSLEDLRLAIHAANQAWKEACQWLGPSSTGLEAHAGEHTPLSETLRDMKDCLQLRLLQQHPNAVRLELDHDVAGRPEYSIRLPELGLDAAHCPVDRIEAWLPLLPREIAAQHWSQRGRHEA